MLYYLRFDKIIRKQNGEKAMIIRLTDDIACTFENEQEVKTFYHTGCSNGLIGVLKGWVTTEKV